MTFESPIDKLLENSLLSFYPLDVRISIIFTLIHVLCRSLFILFLLAIVLSVLLVTTFHYPFAFGIFKLFFSIVVVIVW